jgi:hypothetical protein
MFILCVILANSMTLITDRYPMTVYEKDLKFKIYALFYFIYCIEMFIKILGSGFKIYAQDIYNSLDAMIVLVGTIEFILWL